MTGQFWLLFVAALAAIGLGSTSIVLLTQTVYRGLRRYRVRRYLARVLAGAER